MIHNKITNINYSLFRNKLNLKEAIKYIADGWNNVTQKTIRNCWIKTGILPSYIDNDDVNFDLRNFEPDSDATEIEDLLDNLPETDNVRNYFQILDHEIPAEENLTEEQIVNLIQLEKKEESEEDDDSNNEIPPVSIKEAIGGLETFIIYFQQQTDPEFDVNDLCIFRKYLKVSKVQEFNSKKQSTLDMFFES